uniref:Uncharacterized protein n=1 Tax=uncultured prokaryote TaxID=198431 RepID=A0A0H5Q8H6_9ZZZZ|nr:hypothetical protein [uncultured prokaryote]
MSIVLAQIELRAASLIPADNTVNTLYFDIDRSDIGVTEETIMNSVGNSIWKLYDGISNWLSAKALAATGNEVKFYDLADPSPRVPFFIYDLPLIPMGNTDHLPMEVALCTSFQGDKESGVSQASRRGRIFIGGLSNSSNDNGRPLDALRSALAQATHDLAEDSGNESNWTWIIWSRTNSAGTTVKNGWVDNAFDTQRRRGVSPTTRSTWTEDAG